jgi:DNA invertase Pin-like site-specific DNA recombinase
VTAFGYRNTPLPAHPESGAAGPTFRDRVKGYALLHGLELEHCYSETPADAWKPFRERRKAEAMLQQARAGDVVIAPAVEQIFCSATDALDSLAFLRERGIALHVTTLAGDLAADARHDGLRELIAFFAGAEKRLEVPAAAAAPDPDAPGRQRGRVPFGYVLEDGKRRRNRQEQKAIRYMETLRNKGIGYNRIARRIRDRFGYSFSHMGIKKILEREVAAGTGQPQNDDKKGKQGAGQS